MHSTQENTDQQSIRQQSTRQEKHNQPSLLLSVKQLKIQNAEKKLVENLNFDLHANETIAIVGESGSGKSLSGLAILGLLPKNLAQGKIGSQFAKLAELAGIGEKNFQTIMELMLSKSDLVEKMVAASFLNATTKRNYLQSYQGRLKQLAKV